MEDEMANKTFMEISRQIADQAASGGPGNRRATNYLPANPSSDHRVAFALGDVLTAMEGAVELGATRYELELLIDQALKGMG